MRFETDDDWDVAAERMTRVPDVAREHRGVAARRASRKVSSPRGARRSRARSRRRRGAASARTSRSSARWPRAARTTRTLAAAAELATAGYARLAAYLRDEYAPAADPRNPVGRDRYALFARDFNGIDLDLDETYAWGWEELHRIEDAMRRVGERILPGASIDEVIEHLDADDHRAIEGVDEFRRWNQDLIDQTISDLNGTHFDIARAVADVRGDDRAARRRGRDVLHGTDRGLLPARAARGTRRWARPASRSGRK